MLLSSSCLTAFRSLPALRALLRREFSECFADLRELALAAQHFHAHGFDGFERGSGVEPLRARVACICEMIVIECHSTSVAPFDFQEFDHRLLALVSARSRARLVVIGARGNVGAGVDQTLRRIRGRRSAPRRAAASIRRAGGRSRWRRGRSGASTISACLPAAAACRGMFCIALVERAFTCGAFVQQQTRARRACRKTRPDAAASSRRSLNRGDQRPVRGEKLFDHARCRPEWRPRKWRATDRPATSAVDAGRISRTDCFEKFFHWRALRGRCQTHPRPWRFPRRGD